MSKHYDPDIQAHKDYEAMNADTRLRLNQALRRIAELEADNEAYSILVDRYVKRIAELEGAISWVAEHAPDIEVSIATYARAALKGDSDGSGMQCPFCRGMFPKLSKHICPELNGGDSE